MKNQKTTLALVPWLAVYGHLEETLKSIQNKKIVILN
jgi:hypothetical protein